MYASFQLVSWYAARVITAPEKTIVANVLRGNIRPKAAATQLALTATSLLLEKDMVHDDRAEGDDKTQKKQRYKRSRTYQIRTFHSNHIIQ